MATVARIHVYPIKGLAGTAVTQARILEGGTLAYDREFALFDADGEVVNGKRTADVHRIDVDVDPPDRRITLGAPDAESRQFDLASPTDREAAAAWCSERFGMDLDLKRDRRVGYVDRRELGPSVISAGTLRAIADWFEDLTPAEVRRRLRPNLVLEGVPPFWEDGLLGRSNGAFRVGGIRFEAAGPCGRCVVPGRDAVTGEPTPEFRETFIRNRRTSRPDWVDPDAIEHAYTAMILTTVPMADRGSTVRVGEEITLPPDAHPLGIPEVE